MIKELASVVGGPIVFMGVPPATVEMLHKLWNPFVGKLIRTQPGIDDTEAARLIGARYRAWIRDYGTEPISFDDLSNQLTQTIFGGPCRDSGRRPRRNGALSQEEAGRRQSRVLARHEAKAAYRDSKVFNALLRAQIALLRGLRGEEIPEHAAAPPRARHRMAIAAVGGAAVAVALLLAVQKGYRYPFDQLVLTSSSQAHRKDHHERMWRSGEAALQVPAAPDTVSDHEALTPLGEAAVAVAPNPVDLLELPAITGMPSTYQEKHDKPLVEVSIALLGAVPLTLSITEDLSATLPGLPGSPKGRM